MVLTPSSSPTPGLEQDETRMVNDYAERMGKVIVVLEKMFPHSDDDSRSVQESFCAADGTKVEVAHSYNYYDPSDVNSLMAPMRPAVISKSGHVSITANDEDATTYALRFNYPDKGDVSKSVDDGNERLTFRNTRNLQPEDVRDKAPTQQRKFMKNHPDRRVFNTADVDPLIVMQYGEVLNKMLRYMEEMAEQKEATSALVPKALVQKSRTLLQWLLRRK